MRGSNIYLIGFMGTGKSTVGKCLGQRLGLGFLDTDALIELETGRTIAQLFESRGEPWFRKAERKALMDTCRLRNTVVSLGGGAFIDERNVRAAKSAGTVIWLRSGEDEIMARLGSGPDDAVFSRPVLGGSLERDKIRALLASRERGYMAAHAVIDTDGLNPQEIAYGIIKMLGLTRSAPNREIPVSLELRAGSHVYPYLLGPGALTSAGRQMSICQKVFVVTNSLVKTLYGEAINSIPGRPDIVWALVPDGERAKSLACLQGLYTLACESKVNRDTLVIALGGGVIGDLAGFFAATYMRGLKVMHMPTTLLSMVDSSIGGKTGVNLKAGKNLAGAFWQPCSVVSDTTVLRTLPAREIRCGLAEVVKSAVIGDPMLFDMLERWSSTLSAASLLDDPAISAEIIGRSVMVKARLIEGDERDSGHRMLLNLGHTLGHAVEKAGRFRTYSHGEAVSIGLAAVIRAGIHLGMTDQDSGLRVIRLLSSLGLPTALKSSRDMKSKLRQAMSMDKKVSGTGMRLIIPLELGRCAIKEGIDPGFLIDKAFVDGEHEEALTCAF